MTGSDDRTSDTQHVERGFSMRDAPEQSADDPILGTDFSTFVLSLGTSAFYHLGVVQDPERQGDPAPPKEPDESDRLIARQTISTLEMIAEKTQGNLQPDEEKLLESILYELRTRYVAAQK